MKRTLIVGVVLLTAVAIGLPPSFGIGFHGGGGGFHGGGIGGGGFHGGGFGGGGIGGGGIGGGGMGGLSGGGFSGGGFNRPSFDHAGTPSFGNHGLGDYRFGAGGAGGFGEGRGAAAGRGPQTIENRFAGQGARGLDEFGRGGPGFRPNSPVTNSELQKFLGIGGPSATWPGGHAGNRPAWQNLSPDAVDRIHSSIAQNIGLGRDGEGQRGSWLDNHPDRAQQWQDRGDEIRRNWNNANVRPGSDWWSKYHPNVDNWREHGARPGSDWWSKYHPNLDQWYYHHDWHNHDWRYWWGYSTWGVIMPWFAPWGWSEPVYYDYGDGGNVVYEGDDVYVNGEDVGTAEQYAQSASELATVPPSADDSAQQDGTQGEEWLPLGTFAVVTSKDDSNPTRMLQLAVDKQGVVSGTLHNGATKKDYVVQGRVDKQSQRVAITFGSNSNVVLETGIYNLTQAQTPVLVHYGPDKTENLFLVRLDAPSDESANSASADSSEDPLAAPSKSSEE